MINITSKKIREIRLNLGLTQAEASKCFGGGTNAFNRYENKVNKASPLLKKVLNMLDQQPNLLIYFR